jgi:hypothetical protein
MRLFDLPVTAQSLQTQTGLFAGKMFLTCESIHKLSKDARDHENDDFGNLLNGEQG